MTDSQRSPELQQAVEAMALGSAEHRGAVYTKDEVVGFMMDLCGYRYSERLWEMTLLEPSCGSGEFIIAAVNRILQSQKKHGVIPTAKNLRHAITAIELHADTAKKLQESVVDILIKHGLKNGPATEVSDNWIVSDDFLLHDFPRTFDVVIGNPPYVRQELISDVLLGEYRKRYATIFDRADLYVPFIERGLNLLSPSGKLCFICSDRWMKNRYGKPLRTHIATNYHLDTYIDMVDTDAFHNDVMAYPAITVFSRLKGTHTKVSGPPLINPLALGCLSAELTCPSGSKSISLSPFPPAMEDAWDFDTSPFSEVLGEIEKTFPLIEDSAISIGIGVASGCDAVYVTRDRNVVEEDRLLPLLMAADVLDNEIKWSGKYLVNPWSEQGPLVDLKRYKKLADYFESNSESLKGRNVGKRNPDKWHRTIDKVIVGLQKKEKLLIPDIKSRLEVGYDVGKFYPHHNLYWVTSDEWDLRALRTVLKSTLALGLVKKHSVKMRGGFFRFQAQYLRKIRVPNWSMVSHETRKALIEAGKSSRQSEIDEAVAACYSLSQKKVSLLKAYAADD